MYSGVKIMLFFMKIFLKNTLIDEKNYKRYSLLSGGSNYIKTYDILMYDI